MIYGVEFGCARWNLSIAWFLSKEQADLESIAVQLFLICKAGSWGKVIEEVMGKPAERFLWEKAPRTMDAWPLDTSWYAPELSQHVPR